MSPRAYITIINIPLARVSPTFVLPTKRSSRGRIGGGPRVVVVLLQTTTWKLTPIWQLAKRFLLDWQNDKTWYRANGFVISIRADSVAYHINFFIIKKNFKKNISKTTGNLLLYFIFLSSQMKARKWRPKSIPHLFFVALVNPKATAVDKFNNLNQALMNCAVA